MPVVIKGKSRGAAGQMARYAEAQGKNEFAALREVRGTIAQDARGAIEEMAALATGSRCAKFLYHAEINPAKGSNLTPEQWAKAVDTLEHELKLDGHQRVIFEHVKDGRQHYHVVWNRIDPETMKAVNMGNNYNAHERAAAQIEKDCGLEQMERPRLNRDHGREPDPHSPARARAPKDWEYHQAARNGEMNPRELKAALTEIYNQSANGKEFAAAIAESGFTLGRGSKTDFILIPEHGTPLNLARQIEGAKIADIREKFSDLDRAKLPTEEQHRAEQQKQEQRDKQSDFFRVEKIKDEPKLQAQAAAKEGKAGAPPKEASVTKGAARAFGKVADLLMDTVCSLLAGMGEGKKEITPEQYLHDKEARQKFHQEQAAEARREEERDAAFDELRAGKGLEVEMLRSFRREDLETIKAHGADEGVSLLLEQEERSRQEERERERYRER